MEGSESLHKRRSLKFSLEDEGELGRWGKREEVEQNSTAGAQEEKNVEKEGMINRIKYLGAHVG